MRSAYLFEILLIFLVHFTLEMIGAKHCIRSFVHPKLFGWYLDDYCFAVGSTTHHYSFGHEYLSFFSNGNRLIDIFGVLQDFTAEERNRGASFQRNRRLSRIDSNRKTFEIHTREHTYHSAPSVTHKRNALLRAHKSHYLFSSKVIGEIKIEIAPYKELTIFGFIAPNR